MQFRKQLPGILLLFLLVFTYRFSFREDFRIWEMLQISLSTLSDVTLILLSTSLILTTQRRLYVRMPRGLANFITVLIGVTTFWVSVQVLIAIHRQIYLSTTGMTDQFKSIFDSLSYQVFDSYLVIAMGIIVLFAYRFYIQWTEQKRLTKAIEQERIQAELNYLKAQINPHFIFNTLNNMQFLIDESNEKARKLIQDFGDLLRYQLYETGQQEVSVSQEIQYLQQYVDIQKVRKEEGFNVEFQFDEFKSIQIAPLLLIIPLENAFKYSPNSNAGYIKIALRNMDDTIQYTVENSVCTKNHSDLTRGGLGIENLTKRLNLIYGSRARFTLKVNDDTAVAQLSINTTQNEA